MSRLRTTAAAAVLAAAASFPLAGVAIAQDLDCSDVTQEEAQSMLDSDPSDPNRFDADDDDLACEGGGGTDTSDDGSGSSDDDADQVENKPEGGVETGDGSTSDAGGLGYLLGGFALAAAGGTAFAARRSLRQEA